MRESLGGKPQGVMKVNHDWNMSKCPQSAELGNNSNGSLFELEHRCKDPKDGELCLNRVKSEETLMEARSDSDVQIDRQIWV